MTFRDQLEKLKACPESLEWVKGKTIEEAWETCKNSKWMIWVLTQTDLDLIDPICDMAESVLHLVPEDNRLVCSNAISAARSRASKDELNTADAAVWAAANVASYANAASYAAAHWAAAYAIAMFAAAADTDVADADVSDAAVAVADSAADAFADAAYYTAYASRTVNYDYFSRADYEDADNAARSALRKEQNKQCDIFRKYFTIDQIREAFNKLVA